MAKDHCTASPEGNWGHCCEAHDFHYSKMSTVTRLQADIYLYECIKQRSIIVATIYFIGVRLFGWTKYDKGL